MPYNFSIQKKIFQIALEIISDYTAKEWSFGGGTALSVCYWQHRMSFDIDIFTEDALFMARLLENKKTIAKSLQIPLESIQHSEKNITFILDGKYKLDFLYAQSLTTSPYNLLDVFGYKNIKVQKPVEIIAKKLLHREIMTIRDFVDFTRYSFDSNLKQAFTDAVFHNIYLKEQGFNPLERLFNIIDHLNIYSHEAFDTELKHLNPKVKVTYKDTQKLVISLIQPDDLVKIATQESEIVAAGTFVDFYKDSFEQIGDYVIHFVSKSALCDFFQIPENILTYRFLLGKHFLREPKTSSFPPSSNI